MSLRGSQLDCMLMRLNILGNNVNTSKERKQFFQKQAKC
jgi:hypothetical protein